MSKESFFTKIKALVKALPSLLKETVKEWQQDNAMRLAAALSYYTVFSLAPLVLAAIAIAGLFLDDKAASGEIFKELHAVVGPSVAGAVEDMVKAADKPRAGVFAATMAFVLGIFGASGVFGELMGSLNQIWGVKEAQGTGIWGWIKGRFLSMGMVMGVCFLLLVSLLANTIFGTIANYGLRHIPWAGIVGQIVGFVLSFGFVTVLFAAMFKFLPQTKIQWKDVWTGAAVTALLFSVGKFGLEQYLTRSDPASMYGAAGALALVLIWVYYSAQIFFFGAEFTEVYARRLGSRFHYPAPADSASQPPAVETSGAMPYGSVPAAGVSSSYAQEAEHVPASSSGGAPLLKVALVLLAAWVADRRSRGRS